MPRQQVAKESFVILVVEVEEGIAVIAVNAEVPAGKDLDPAAGVPAGLGGLHVGRVRSVQPIDHAGERSQ